MFGKRSEGQPVKPQAAPPPGTFPQAPAAAGASPGQIPSLAINAPPQAPARAAPAPEPVKTQPRRSDQYYDIKGTIFNALIDAIADIMVNGCSTTFIEVGGRVQPTNVRFRDNAQLLNICQRIVSQVGRRVDEASPICDARLPDGSRVNVIVPPLSIDGPALTIRKFKKDRLKLTDLVKFKSITPEGATILEII